MADPKDQSTHSMPAPAGASTATPTNAALWGGRFTEATDAFVQAFTASVTFDQRLADYDIQGSLAHAKMLAAQKIITDEDHKAIVKGLSEIKAEIDRGEFQWSIALEDVHMNIESRLTQLIGAAGKKLHTGRSRNDQIATDIRLFLRDEIDAIANQLLDTVEVLGKLAQREYATIMPGFTHLQTAQPVTFGHHMLAWAEMLKRDHGRLIDSRARCNSMPLGSAALAGTPYPLDRELTMSELGFESMSANSLDAVSDRDFIIEFCSFASVLMMHMSRFSEELILWTSAQFGFINLPDKFCTGSSIMPQKKNPDVPELLRGKTGRVYGHLMSVLTLMKSQPLAYNKDNQEDKEPLFDTVDTVRNSLTAFRDMMAAVTVNPEAMRVAVSRGFATATDLADYLVGKGLPFRDAHEVVGKAVAWCVEHGGDLSDLPLEQLQSFHSSITADVNEVLTLEGSVNARKLPGGTAPDRVAEAASATLSWVEERRSGARS